MNELEPKVAAMPKESCDGETDRFLYVIGPRNGPLKIGISNDVAKRRRLLNTGNHLHLHVHFYFDAGSEKRARELERGLHYTFFKKRILGEWFDLSGDDLTTVRNTCNISSFFDFPVPEEWSMDRVTCTPFFRDLCKKARLALALSEEDVAELADLSLQTVRNFEDGKGGPNQETVDSIKDALKAKGAIFTEEAGVIKLSFTEG